MNLCSSHKEITFSSLGANGSETERNGSNSRARNDEGTEKEKAIEDLVNEFCDPTCAPRRGHEPCRTEKSEQVSQTASSYGRGRDTYGLNVDIVRGMSIKGLFEALLVEVVT